MSSSSDDDSFTSSIVRYGFSNFYCINKGKYNHLYRKKKAFVDKTDERKIVSRKICRSPFRNKGKPIRPEDLNSSESDGDDLVKDLIDRFMALNSVQKKLYVDRLNKVIKKIRDDSD